MLVDWLGASLEADALDSLVEVLTDCTGFEVTLRREAGGWQGFTCKARLFAGAVSLGLCAWGGEHQRARMTVQLSGSGCSLVQSWAPLVDLLHLWSGRLTRVDIAADFYDGFQVDDALAAFKAGDFNGRGRPPCGQLVDDLGSGKGRTLYIGSGERVVRVYEKDKETGGPKVGPSSWVRVELQQRRGDREIPVDALLDPGLFFAGAYNVLAQWIGRAGSKMAYIKAKTVATIERAVGIARTQAGGVVGFLTRRAGLSSGQVVSMLQRAPNERLLELDAFVNVVAVEAEFFDIREVSNLDSDELLNAWQ